MISKNHSTRYLWCLCWVVLTSPSRAACGVELLIAKGVLPLFQLTNTAPVPITKVGTVFTAISIEYAKLLHIKSSQTQIYRLHGNPRIILVDFASLHVQALTMNRIAGLIEKKDFPTDRVLRHAELYEYFKDKNINPNTFYYGHNYTAENLLKFFNILRHDAMELNTYEQHFLQALQDIKVLELSNGSYRLLNPPQVVVTLTQTSDINRANAAELRQEPEDFVDMAVRCTVLRHELSHGEFSTNPKYRQATYELWHNVLTDHERATFKTFLHSKGYDDDNEELMANETQAYLMHSPNLRAFDPKRVGFNMAQIAKLRAAFLSRTAESAFMRIFYPKGKVTQQHLVDINCNF